MDIKQRMGLRIKVLRENRGITQETLAKAIGRTNEAVSQLERGLNLPRFETLLRMRDAFGITLSELMTGVDADKSPARTQLEETWRDMAAHLDDADLALAISQVQALIRMRKGK